MKLKTIADKIDFGVAFHEMASKEPHPLALLQPAILDWIGKRDDAVVFGGQAVNAYVKQSRMTEDIDALSTHAKALIENLRDYLADRFHIALRIRTVSNGKGFRLYQVRKPTNRNLVDIRSVEVLPAFKRIAGVKFVRPVDLLAGKVMAYASRLTNPKSGTDWRDIAMLLIKFPQLKFERREVYDALIRLGASEFVLRTWEDIVNRPISESIPEY